MPSERIYFIVATALVLLGGILLMIGIFLGKRQPTSHKKNGKNIFFSLGVSLIVFGVGFFALAFSLVFRKLTGS